MKHATGAMLAGADRPHLDAAEVAFGADIDHAVNLLIELKSRAAATLECVNATSGTCCSDYSGRQRDGRGSGSPSRRGRIQGRHSVVVGEGEALAADLEGLGVTGSNQSNDDLRRLVDPAMNTWGRIDVLVNSAGHGPRAPLLDLTDEQWHTGLDVYLMNVVRAVRLVAPIMQRQRAGTIVNISTAWALEPAAGFPTSAVFRAGLAAYTKLFADAYAADNVRMNNILPGWIDSLPATEERRATVPMGRYGTSDEIAATIAFLASDGAGYITGQNIRVDGGLTRSI